MTAKITVTTLVALVLAAFAADPAPATAADAAAGKDMAAACAGCHGEDGVSETALTPSLAGEPNDFVQWQLVFFRSGSRKSDLMEGIAQSLNNEDIRNLGAYYASLPAPRSRPAAATDQVAQRGAALAAENRCQACHGEGFAGSGAVARLAGQREDVLLKALRDFKSGRRVGSGVASMADATYPLGDDDMQALAHYMATRP